MKSIYDGELVVSMFSLEETAQLGGGSGTIFNVNNDVIAVYWNEKESSGKLRERLVVKAGTKIPLNQKILQTKPVDPPPFSSTKSGFKAWGAAQLGIAVGSAEGWTDTDAAGWKQDF